MKKEIYKIGYGNAPEWCRRFILLYRKSDGTTGYHFVGKTSDFYLNKGDEIIRINGKIKVKQRRKRNETR